MEKLSIERKLELRELQLREAIARAALSEAHRAYEKTVTDLSKAFTDAQVTGQFLSPETLEYREMTPRTEV